MATQTRELDARVDHDALRLHALKNCAATITVLSKLIAKSDAPDRGHLARLQDAATRMKELLCDSLAHPMAELEVSELLDSVRREVEPKAETSQVQLDFSHIRASVRGSARDLREALLNLVQNAVEASPPGGHVRVVHTADEAGAHSFLISDEGPGMSAAVHRAAGRRRVRSSKPDGSGIGLFLARRAVEDQGGRLDIQSGTQGTTIRVLLPAA